MLGQTSAGCYNVEMKNVRRNLAIFLTVTLVGLLILHLIFRTASIDNWDYWELVGLFDMDSEISLYTWYSTTILLFVPACLLAFIAYKKKQSGDKLAWCWWVVSGVFLFFSIDDGAMIHEKLSTVNRLIGLQDILGGGIFAWSWWVIYLPIGILLAILLCRWFLSLPLRTKVFVGAGILVAIIGQMGMEAVSSLITSSTGEYIGPVWRGFQKFIGRAGLSIVLFGIVDYMLINKKELFSEKTISKKS